MDAWWSEATQLQFASQNGGNYTGGPFRGVIHTTETKKYTPSTKTYYGHHNPPHFTVVSGSSDEVTFYQHFPITVAARLENHKGGVQTNRRSAIQIEIAWKAKEIDQLPFAMVMRLWDWMRWVETQTDIKRWIRPTFQGSSAYGQNSSARMSDAEWNDFNGWCGHQHVPENSHWDPGKLDIDKLTQITRPGTPRCEVSSWF